MTGRQPCIICGRPTTIEHHLTGSQLDPDLNLPHCHDHHQAIHDDWNTADVPAKNRGKTDHDEDGPPTFLHALYLRLTRLAMSLGGLGEAGLMRPVFGLLATALADWATRLGTCIEALNTGMPGWVNLPGMSEGDDRL